MSRTVAEALGHQARLQPDAEALFFPAGRERDRTRWESLTFGELDRLSDRYARGFQAQGIEAGDRTLMLMKPSLELFAVLFGLFKLGAIPVFMDPGMGMKPLLACCAQIRPKVLIAIPAVHALRMVVRRPFASVERFITVGRRWCWGGLRLSDCCSTDDAPFDFTVPEPSAEAAIAFTSGSTGTPKGVAITQGAFAFQVEALGRLYGLGPGETTVECFALFALFDLALGARTIIPEMDLSKPGTADPARIVEAIERFEAGIAFASPIVWVNTARYCQEQEKALPSLKRLLTAGAPIQADLHRKFRSVLREGVEVWTPYGATESLPLTHIGSTEVLAETWKLTVAGAGTCVGAPVEGAQVHVIRITEEPIASWSDDLLVEDGEVGELVAQGPMVSPEYKDRPDANASAKINANGVILHRMGDLGYRDEKGRIWFCGRKAHRLLTPAGMVPAVPVEGVFNEHPDVLRSALVGLGEPGQQVPVLVVEAEPGRVVDAAAVLALGQGTRWEGLVTQLLVHPGFPVDARHNSKIRREDIRVWAAGRAAVAA